MQLSVKLQEPFSYSILPIIILIIIIVIFSICFFKKMNKKKEKPKIKEIDKIDINIIKQKYIMKLEELKNDLEKSKLSIRQAYQNLSELVRYFVYEVTDIEVQNYTLKEIKKLNMPVLYNLIKEYYSPEFANISLGNVKESIERAEEVIKKWS